ncbi:MAG TPA: DUF1015 domain-containing protein [Thermoanaerobaculia bacterium]|nr:DUF1015 domain-containing protein [Thermoanaerobaculia bacterium]
MRLHAFQGLRFGPRAGDAGQLAAPPYDQIDDAARDRFHVLSPYQFVHLTRPVAGAAAAAAPGDTETVPQNPYRNAAALHARWLSEGIVERDPEPALYPYVIELAGGGRRLGVMALVGYEDATVIRPHEQTLDKPLADRTALLEATRADLEPALLLVEDEGRLEELLAADLPGKRPLVTYPDEDGNSHLLFRVADPRRIAQYQHAVRDAPAAIADGHHRYKVGQRFACEHRPPPGSAAAAKLAVVTSMTAPALAIDPIHRGLRQPIDTARAAERAQTIEPLAAPNGGALAAAVAAAATAGGGRLFLGVWVRGRRLELWRLAVTSAVGGGAGGVDGAGGLGAPCASGRAGEAARPLVVEIFHNALLPALGLPPEAATDGTLLYRSDPEELYRQVAAGELGTGFWLPPMRPADFAAAIARGDLLPPKSTRFLPKVMSGLVWADHRSTVM